MKILHEDTNMDSKVAQIRDKFVDNLDNLQRCYDNVKEAVKALQNVDFTAVYGVKLPDIEFIDHRSQTDILEGMISEPATAPEVEYLENLNKKLSSLC